MLTNLIVLLVVVPMTLLTLTAITLSMLDAELAFRIRGISLKIIAVAAVLLTIYLTLTYGFQYV